jgi:protein TonB
LTRLPQTPPYKPSVVEVDMRKPPAPPPPKIEAPPPPKPPEPPPRKVVPIKKAAPPPPQAPPPNAEPPKEPPKDPPKPVFGVTMSSTTEGDSSFSVPVGNTTMIDPKKSGKGPAVPLPAAPAAPAKPEYKPVSELYIKSMPDIDSEACGKSVQYPAEAEQLGIEGTVHLRIELDEKGKVHGLKVTSGLGHGLDDAAKYALTHRCKFSPAVATDGKAVPYVINDYKFNFEIPR